MMIRRKRAASRRRPTRRDESWGHSQPSRIEQSLIEASQRIVNADSAMASTLPALRAGKRSVVKANIKYLERLIAEAAKYLDRANQEIGF